MMITGQIAKEGSLWRAECPLVGAYTQGKSRADAAAMLADCIEVLIDHPGLHISVAEIGPVARVKHAYAVSVGATDVSLLLAEVLKHQRRLHKLTIAEVATRLGAKSSNAYAAYEQGQREPSLSKFVEFLSVVAPELALTVVPRAR